MATMLYHRTNDPMIVTEDKVAGLLAQGWADTPAVFYAPGPALVGDGETDNSPILEALIAKSADPCIPMIPESAVFEARPNRKGWPKGKPRVRKADA